MAETLERRRFRVRGNVQGVAFRAHARDAAQRIGCTGNIANLEDGSVAGEVQGPPDAVARFVDWLGDGSPAADVASVDTEAAGVVTGEDAFTVQR